MALRLPLIIHLFRNLGAPEFFSLSSLVKEALQPANFEMYLDADYTKRDSEGDCLKRKQNQAQAQTFQHAENTYGAFTI